MCPLFGGFTVVPSTYTGYTSSASLASTSACNLPLSSLVLLREQAYYTSRYDIELASFPDPTPASRRLQYG